MKVVIRATIPDELLQKWLQHVRDFDTANPKCHFEIMADAPDMSMEEMIRKLQVNPALNFIDFFKRKK